MIDALALNNVSIVDPRNGELAHDMSILIDNGRIVRVTPAGTVQQGASVKQVDAHNQFAVPGYNDMHVHALIEKNPSAGLALMLACGITGFRQMAGTPQLLEKRAAGQLPLSGGTPALLAMPGEILTPFSAGTPEAAVRTVRKQKAEGVDFIKVGMASPAAFFAALAECRELGLPFVGHLQEGVDAAKAAKGGMRSIEHLGPRDTILISCSTDEAELRQEIARLPGLKAPPFKIPFMGLVMAVFLQRLIINPLHGTKPDIARLRRILATFDEDKCRQIAEVFVANGTWQAPTLIRERTMELGDAPEYLNDPNLRYMPAKTVESWRKVARAFTAEFSPEARATFKELYTLQLKLTQVFDTVGVRMLAGSDACGAGWVIPGFSLHQEFDALESAGVSPLHVLQMTTSNPAEFLGKTSQMGAVEAGKNADIVLLGANPLDSVQNLHSIAGVVRAGCYYSRAELDALKSSVEAHQGRFN
jgi:imidazolonepropionase-like amidohydrolase